MTNRTTPGGTLAANKHTPGPWTVMFMEKGVPFTVVPDGRDGDICQMSNAAFPCAENPDEQNANANLIAAAPDLLAACERGLAALRSALDAACLGEGADVDALVAAIEKARAK